MDTMEPDANNRSTKRNSLMFPPEHIVAFYTLLAVLLKMKKDLGLEAMLEYMALYLKVIDSHNPKIATVVTKTLEIIPIEVLYHEMGDFSKNT